MEQTSNRLTLPTLNGILGNVTGHGWRTPKWVYFSSFIHCRKWFFTLFLTAKIREKSTR